MVTTTPIVGRDADLSMLAERRRAAGDGEPSLVVVGGDAGVGKTRLVRAAAAAAADEGWLVLTGGCVELSDGAVTLAPVADVLRQLGIDRGDAALAALLDGPARGLAPLVPELGLEVDGLGAASSSQVLVSFHRLLRDLADEAPVLLVIEDVHWADASTRDLLGHLAGRLYKERLLVVVTVRTDDLDRRHPLRPVLAELGRRPDVERIDLGPLDHGTLVTYLHELAGERPPGDLREIARRAAGNPFYAEELLAAAVDGLPPSVEDALGLRLDRLPQDTQVLLADMAVVGASIDARLVAAVSRLDEPRVGPALRAAIDDGILHVDGDRYVFRHALLRELAADRLLPTERVRAHAAAASAIEAQPELAVTGRAGAAGQVAHHWWEARDQPRCLAASVAAATEAEGQHAGPNLLRHARRALELWDRVEDPEQVSGTTYLQLLLRAARVAILDTDPAAHALASEAIRAADETDDDEARARAAGMLSVALMNAGDAGKAVEVAAEELARHDEAPTVARAIALSAHAQAAMFAADDRDTTWDLDQLAGQFDEAVRIATTCDDGDALAVVLVRMIQSMAGYVPGLLDTPLERLFGLTERDDVLGEWRHQAHLIATDGSFTAHDLTRAEIELDRWRAHSADAGAPFKATLELWVLGLAVDRQRGRFDRFEERIDEYDLRDVATSHVKIAVVETGDWLRWTGRFDRATERAAFALEAEAIAYGGGAIVAGELAACLAAAGAPVEEVMAAARRVGQAAGGRRWHDGLATQVAAVARAAGEQPLGESTLTEIDGWIEQVAHRVDWIRDDAPIKQAAVARLAHARAERAHLAGRPDPDLWDDVIAHYDRVGLVPDAAVARLRRAAAHAAVQDGSSPACEDDLLAASTVFDELALPVLQDDVRALARRLRVTLPDDDEDEAPLAELTDREREVLELVAEGWTNKRVGEHLFISPKTVSVHMSNAMRKLGVDSRTEAVATAHRAGLLPEA